MSQRTSQRGKTKEKIIESPRPLVDPDRPEFTIGFILNVKRSAGFIDAFGDVESAGFIDASRDVEGETVRYYTSIENLIGALEDHLKHKVVNGFVVLSPPPAEGQAVPLFKIILHHENENDKTKRELLPLLFRKDDLYFVGFKSDEGQWYEYMPQQNKREYIEGSKNLPFDCSYMHRYDKKGIGLSKICVNSNILEGMFLNLRAFKVETNHKNVPYHKIQEFCDIVCLFICEATRFKRVREHFINIMKDEKIVPFGKELEELIKTWAAKSKEAKVPNQRKDILEKLKAEISVIKY